MDTITAILLIVVILLTVYMAIRDREIGKKSALLERAIDILNNEIYKTDEKSRKKLTEITHRIEELERRVREDEKNGARMDATERERIEQDIRSFAKRMEEEIETLRGRVGELEAKMRRMTIAVEHGVPDEQTILRLHAAGMDAESIAKKLRMGKGEVELVLRFANMGQ